MKLISSAILLTALVAIPQAVVAQPDLYREGAAQELNREVVELFQLETETQAGLYQSEVTQDMREINCGALSTIPFMCGGDCRQFRQTLGQLLGEVLGGTSKCMLITGTCVRTLGVCHCDIVGGFQFEVEVPCGPTPARVGG